MHESSFFEVRAGGASRRVGPKDEALDPLPVYGAGALILEAGGLEPNGVARITLGPEELFVGVGRDGHVRFVDERWLMAVAGRARVAIADGDIDDAPELAIELLVRPTKLAEESLRALIADLDAVAPGLSSDLGGKALVETKVAATPEAALTELERVVGAVLESATWVRHRPLARVREQVTAVSSESLLSSARDVRWLAIHPASALRAGASGRGVAVQRARVQDLDVPENRGVVELFCRIEELVRALGSRLSAERERIEATRAAREAFITERGNLFAEQDVPRLRGIERRRSRLAALEADLASARACAALPPGLPKGRLTRSAHVEAHPGYWGLFRASAQLEALEVGAPLPAFVPLDSLDALYETWCSVELARSVARTFDSTLFEVLRLDRDRWFVRIPKGEYGRVDRGPVELRLLFEPLYEHTSTEPLSKLHPGRPWCPDVVLEIRKEGRPVALHVFDAKHRVDPNRFAGVPKEALHEVLSKYPDSIGFTETRLPAVMSAWVLYPGPFPHVELNSPMMLSSAWPAERVRGGAIALRPGLPECSAKLDQVLEAMLAPWIELPRKRTHETAEARSAG
ncbi:MAG: hypothetical protein HYV07_13900 [Deltaproteobacteria bacterium]|nr:hypothetical protein [Deltaproteobacteria bacterium]